MSASLFQKYIEKLFCMIAEDISGSTKEGYNVAIASVHPSIKRRNLIDLQQSLQITGAFESYVRRYFPNMVKEEDYHIVMKMILCEIEDKTCGKLKKLAKSLEQNVIREPALEDKIWKVYKGDSGEEPFEPCISESWFKKDEIRKLGHEANLWRNELAHSKGSYEPKLDTIRAIRLLEHLNYAIVLRKMGFNNNEIKELLQVVLRR